MRIGFVVGDLVGISGGSNVIIEHATGLRRLGHEVVVITTQPADVSSTAGWHPRLRDLQVLHVSRAGDLELDVALATWWLTWFDLPRLRSRIYGYFNQSLESRFHVEPHYKLLNRITYALPVLFVTEARWLADFVGMVRPESRVLCVPNGLSREYFPCVESPPQRAGPLRVLVEGPWAVTFKGVPEAFAVLEEARERVGFSTGWLTSNAGGATPRVGGAPVAIHEKVPIDRVRDVLQQYDVLIKLSRVEGVYGPPLEMFSQGGTAITTTVTGSDEYMIHGYNGLLVQPHNRGQIVRYLEMLDREPAFLAQLRANALETARRFRSWEESTAELSDQLEALAGEGFTNAGIRPALAAISVLERVWLEDLWRHSPSVGPQMAALIHRLRRVKASATYQAAKRLLPAGLRGKLRKYATEMLR